MNTALKLLFLILFFNTLSLKAQQLQWAKQFGTLTFQNTTSIAIDAQGNSYSIGHTQINNTDIDPGEGEYIINPGANEAIPATYLIKLDAQGNFLWGQMIPGLASFSEKSKTMIAQDGNIYTLTYIDYPLGNGANAQIITINKFDSNGNILLTKEIKDMSNNPISFAYLNSNSFTVDAASNIYITGYFANTVVLDPNNAQFNISTTGLGIQMGAFLLKTDPSGNFLWIKVFNEGHNPNAIRQVDLRPDGDLNLILGKMISHFPQPYTYSQELYKINSNDGSTLFQKTFLNQVPLAFTTSSNGEMAIVTGFGTNYIGASTIDIDPSETEQLLTSNAENNIYISWFTPEGQLIANKVYYNDIYEIKDITVDQNYNYYLAGTLRTLTSDYEIDLDPGTEENMISYNGSYGISYLIKFDSSYNYDTAFKLGEYSLFVNNIKVNDEENIYLAGTFKGNNDFDPGENFYWLDTLNDWNGTDGFIMKLGSCNLSAPQGQPNQYLCTISDATIANLSPNNAGIQWYDSDTSTTPLASTHIITDGLTYYASKTSNCGIPDRLAVTAHINIAPAAPVAVNQQFCKSANPTIANLTATGTDIKWYADNTSTTPIDSATLLINGQYYASQTTNGCESQRTAITVALITTPAPTVAASQAFCIDSNATMSNLTVAGTEVKIYDSSTSTTPLDGATPLQNQSYYATQTLNGCESSRIAITVTINNTPVPTASATQIFCAGDSPVINNLDVTGTNIKWYDAATGGNIIPGNTALTDNTTYYASQTINGCESISRCVVTVTIDSANIPAQNYQASFCDSNNDGREIVNLHDYNPHLLPSPAGYDFAYYYSENGAQNKLTSDKINDSENLPISTGTTTIFVRIESPVGCFKIVTLTLEVAPPTPSILPESEYYICQGHSLTIKPNSDFNNFIWSNGSKKHTLTIYQSGNYSVTADYSHGTITCKATFNFTVTALPETHITEVFTADWTNNDNTITIITSPGNDNEYSIDGIHYQHDNHFNNLAPGIYTVHVRDINGCGYDTSEVLLLNYPKFFTPNNDGVNDYWKIDNSFFEKDLSVIIFDRYGKVIRGFKNNESGWDGTLDNKPLPATDYWFVVKRAGKEYKGHFSLIR